MFRRRGLLGDNPPSTTQNPNYEMMQQQWGVDPMMPMVSMGQMMGNPMMSSMMGQPGMPGAMIMPGTLQDSNTSMMGGSSHNLNNMMPVMDQATIQDFVTADPNKVETNVADVLQDHRSDEKNSTGGDRENHQRSKERNSRGSKDRRRSRSRSYGHNRSDKSRTERRGRTKWSNADLKTATVNPIMNNTTMPGNMMTFSNPMFNNTMMGQAQMDMINANMAAQQMPQQPMMHGMMDQNMMSMMAPMYPQMNQSMMGMMPVVPNQAIYLTNGVLMPCLPGTELPARRERPPGCRTIFVGGLPDFITEITIKEIFQRFGTIHDMKLNSRGFCHIRFQQQESVEHCFLLSGYRLKFQDQADSDVTTLLIDYALNRDDQNDHEKRSSRKREKTPPRIEQFSSTTLSTLAEKIKSEDKFAEAAPTLNGWLERGECNKRNANTFYSMIQATNNHIRRLLNEKMQLDEEFQAAKDTFKDKFVHIISQFEQVAKILSAANHQRVWDHFTKQQRRNIEMWQKMTEELNTMKDEFQLNFDDEETEKQTNKKNSVDEKYEELKRQNENLVYELEGYKNEAFVAKDEAERKFEKFKAHYVAEQALKATSYTNKPFTPMPIPPNHMDPPLPTASPPAQPPPPPSALAQHTVSTTEARLIAMLTAFLLAHPRGASFDYLVSYIRSMFPDSNPATVQHVLQKHAEVFRRSTTGIGPDIEHRWAFVAFSDLPK